MQDAFTHLHTSATNIIHSFVGIICASTVVCKSFLVCMVKLGIVFFSNWTCNAWLICRPRTQCLHFCLDRQHRGTCWGPEGDDKNCTMDMLKFQKKTPQTDCGLQNSKPGTNMMI